MKIKIGYKYCNKSYCIDISTEEEIESLIYGNLYLDNRLYVWYPNDEIDNCIRKFVDKKLKAQPFYHGASHAEEIIIYEESDNGKLNKLHKIMGSISEVDTQRIIKQIKEERT